MSKQLVITLPGGLPLGFRLSVLKDDGRFYAVSKIRQHSKAEKSGLQMGDVMLCVNGINCEDLSHVVVTALTDISDVLNLLVLRNAQDSSEIVAAFSNLGQSARRLTQKEIADLTGNQNLSVTRRQSTGCISQGGLYDHHRQTPFKLFGNQKLKQNNFNNLLKTSQRDDLKSDSDDKSVDQGGRTFEKRREKDKIENGSQKRHLVPSRLKNIAQTTEVLEEELEEELRREMNLQMFEEMSKDSSSISTSVHFQHPNRARCASEAPRYKTNMQFKLSTDGIKKNQKVPVTQTKVSIRRFSLAVPGQVSSEQAEQSGILKNKINITQMKPVGMVPTSRRTQFSIRSNSITGIPATPLISNGNVDKMDNIQPSAPTHGIKISSESLSLTKSDQLGKQSVVVNSPSITSSSIKRQVMPATRLRSNSLSVLSSARNPPSSNFERPTNFLLRTGSTAIQIKMDTTTILSSKTEEVVKCDENKPLKLKDADVQTNGMQVDTSAQIFQDSRLPAVENQNLKERKLSFSSQSRALNPLPMVKMPSSAIKIQNKAGGSSKPLDEIFNKSKENIATSGTFSASYGSYPIKGTRENNLQMSDSYCVSSDYPPSEQRQSIITPMNYWTSQLAKKNEPSQHFTRQTPHKPNFTFSPFSQQDGLQLQKTNYNLIQPSNTFQQNTSFDGRQSDYNRFNPPSSFVHSSLHQPRPSSHQLLNDRSAYNTQQSQFSHYNTVNLSSHSNQFKTFQVQDRFNYPSTLRSYQPLSPLPNPVNRPLLTRFNVSSRGHQWQPSSARQLPTRLTSPSAQPSYPDERMRHNQYVPSYINPNPHSAGPRHVDHVNYLNNYSTLPRNFKPSHETGDGLIQKESLSTDLNRNIWLPPSSLSSLDNKYW